MISHKYKCLYVHIPKTAGTSVEKCFGGHDEMDVRLKQDHRTIRNIMAAISPLSTGRFNIKDILVFLNQRYCGYRDQVGFLNGQEFDSYFKFCFVRNPWERAYSWYRNVIRDHLHQAELGISADITFSDFLNYHSDQWALKPQIDWIIDVNGKVAVDFVGKFENLESDFKEICHRLGMQDNKLPMILDSGKVSYVDAYDDDLRVLVETLYRDEIELFEYKFGE